ncbi:MAG: transposase, partial [Lentisphaeria bacterium]|nr:transposase [Lentisphaeria bacterium]
MGNVAQKNEKSIIGAVKIDEKGVMDHLSGLVRQSVEETLNTFLNEEADAICNAGRYQHSPERVDTRAGSYKRKLLTSSGEVELKVPRLRTLPFETQIIKRYQTKQSSVEEALIEMYLAGV